MCGRRIYHNGVFYVQRRPSLLRQLAEHFISKRQAKRAMTKLSPIETAPADQYVFERELPLEGGQRVISGRLDRSSWVDEKESIEMPDREESLKSWNQLAGY